MEKSIRGELSIRATIEKSKTDPLPKWALELLRASSYIAAYPFSYAIGYIGVLGFIGAAHAHPEIRVLSENPKAVLSASLGVGLYMYKSTQGFLSDIIYLHKMSSMLKTRDLLRGTGISCEQMNQNANLMFLSPFRIRNAMKLLNKLGFDSDSIKANPNYLSIHRRDITMPIDGNLTAIRYRVSKQFGNKTT